MLKLHNEVKLVEVYYDGHCGMCCTTQEWLGAQDKRFQVLFFPYQAAEAQRRFNELESLEPSKSMIVRVNAKEIYRGEEAWIWCLWSCSTYWWVAKVINRPLLFPLAKKFCYTLAQNRIKISFWLFQRKAKEVKNSLHEPPNDT